MYCYVISAHFPTKVKVVLVPLSTPAGPFLPFFQSSRCVNYVLESFYTRGLCGTGALCQWTVPGRGESLACQETHEDAD